MTRRAGFTSHPDATGGELEVAAVGGWELDAGTTMEVRFVTPDVPPGRLVGFGAWYYAPSSCEVELDFAGKSLVVQPAAPDWSKFGSQWYQAEPGPVEATFRLSTDRPVTVALYAPQVGVVRHQHFENARPALLKNNHRYAPEANFIEADAHGEIDVAFSSELVREVEQAAHVHLKSCNRCARFLPINVHNERIHLSFSNHCVAPHRVPCTHGGFGRLRDVKTDEVRQLRHGFQLECRFCKKFEVNAPHNPQRTAAQMKEDAARRRAFELLLTELYGGSASLRYRHDTTRELADDIYGRFEGRCFKCGTPMATPRDMHLDHTRPLALLWPLDGTATALCATHNSEKRDRSPSEYYDADELARLSAVTGVELGELATPGPNLDALDRLAARLDWFFDEFLLRPELQTVQDGKLPADLLVKALQKAIDRAPAGPRLDLLGAYRNRRG
jgi:hypothetical protein